ncbi:unnamed protein product [Kuraishia capsulata CBS 1993]|uniref:Copper transport protein n=1 Tax=Kuraishia capsulata CBS 1993 TaxID=1382522 RepID=W6MGU5_9ASCO|nr:uncharacterized protein KUCA_T00000795001 [Kuraishia capsulata CBS 1993]CDK24828.1 unnamed protein product [Kuraishia capsulata CBS 1993]
MNMLLTWDYQDLCVLSSSWHIKNTTGLVLSLFAVILISMGYEYTKFWIHTWEKRQSK